MTTLTVYDPPMCCSTGICGTDVDQRLVDLAADLDWLKAQGVSVRRINLSQEPAEFASNETIRQLMQVSEGDDLPAFLVDGKLVAKARHPSRAELATWMGVSTSALVITEQVRELIALGAAIAASCEPCMKFHTKKAREVGLTDAQVREAVAVGRMIKEASANNIYTLADKLIPEAETTSSGRCGPMLEAAAESVCCGPKTEAAAAQSGCCSGGVKTAAQKDKTGSCC